MSKVVLLSDHKKEYENTEGPGLEDNGVYSGFSDRMNEFLDHVKMDLPPLDKGRISYIAELTGCSRQIVSIWLTKNKPPRDSVDQDKKTSLFKLVAYFMKHLDTDVSLYRIVAWLRYGDEAIESPFKQKQVDDLKQELLIPLAAKVIVEEAKAANMSMSAFNLQLVLEETLNILFDFDVMSYKNILPPHRKIILQCIKNNSH
ncbi:hypothetical protein H0A36_17440 [Endozoicomonas sp. SM1973]|uniref:Uncharacterized protein n=1 Tax=Spartinivicinus marinus TaxID=2994442 RepID=A0A853I1F4_9GAMM|nr:hypothetical protein [Spartinivicinus marinus]MCX4030157.1 hypothetical protein [Spartinivicinus marinus]NYZ67800.1 hypothetical protein [Spartinivicinus marinus]